MKRSRSAFVGLVIAALIATSCTQSEINTDPLRDWEGGVVEPGAAPVAPVTESTTPQDPLAFGDDTQPKEAPGDSASPATTIAADDRLNPEFIFEVDLNGFEPTGRQSLVRFSTDSYTDLACSTGIGTTKLESEPIFEAVISAQSNDSELLLAALTFENIETVGLFNEFMESFARCQDFGFTANDSALDVPGHGPATQTELSLGGTTIMRYVLLERGSIEAVVLEFINSAAALDNNAHFNAVVASTATELARAETI